MSGRFAGKVALVTGAATGIGRATALQLAAEGASLVVTTRRNAAGLDATVTAARALDVRAVGCIADAASSEDTTRAVATALAEFGRLDVLIANAAHVHPAQSAHELDEDEWERTLAVTLKGVFLGAKHAIPAMLETAGGGAIVNVSSANSTIHAPGLSAYSAAKGGVDALTRQLALEYGPLGIRVNAVNPGLIAVERVAAFLDANPDEANTARESTPLGCVGEPVDVARAIAFLASDDARHVTGVTLAVDGGLSIQSAAAVIRPGLRRGWREGRVSFDYGIHDSRTAPTGDVR